MVFGNGRSGFVVVSPDVWQPDATQVFDDLIPIDAMPYLLTSLPSKIMHQKLNTPSFCLQQLTKKLPNSAVVSVFFETFIYVRIALDFRVCFVLIEYHFFLTCQKGMLANYARKRLPAQPELTSAFMSDPPPHQR